MSRFGRSPGTSYLVWAPEASGLVIEYAATLFREVRMASSKGEVCGVLYGVRRASGVRVVTARREGERTGHDSRLAGLEKVGIFATRGRGEVFLTESDLERFEKLESAVVALVIAGTRGGFFVREAGGAIQAIKSHEEFRVEGAPLKRAPLIHAAVSGAPSSVVEARESSRAGLVWIWSLMVVGVVLVSFLLWHRYGSRPAVGLTVREDAGQLRIGWTRGVVKGTGTLEIDDGAERRAVPVTAMLSNVTYARRTGEVQIRLRLDNLAEGRRESASYVGTAPVEVVGSSLAQDMRRETDELEGEAKELRRSIAGGRKRIGQLNAQIEEAQLQKKHR